MWHKPKTKRTGLCPICANEFIKNVHNQKYCSKTCRNKVTWIKYREAHTTWLHNNQGKVMLHSAKQRAKQRELEFSITSDDIVIPDICPVLGIKIEQGIGTRSRKRSSPSLDRIDNTKGYIKGNVRVISDRANSLKSDATIEELERILEDARGNQ
jgi:hypothetical protein